MNTPAERWNSTTAIVQTQVSVSHITQKELGMPRAEINKETYQCFKRLYVEYNLPFRQWEHEESKRKILSIKQPEMKMVKKKKKNHYKEENILHIQREYITPLETLWRTVISPKQTEPITSTIVFFSHSTKETRATLIEIERVAERVVFEAAPSSGTPFYLPSYLGSHPPIESSTSPLPYAQDHRCWPQYNRDRCHSFHCKVEKEKLPQKLFFK